MTAPLSFEQQAYEIPEIWDEDYFTAEDHARVEDLAALVPSPTKTLLDVGCGNGLFLNHLLAKHSARFERLAGTDRSVTALSHVKTEKRAATIDAIPFGDCEFDTVTCMEVLEHIPVTVYPQALAEIARLAKDHIVISVPYRQDLPSLLTECPSCCARFNADFHVRSYDEDKMRNLFSAHGFRAIDMHLLGEEVVRYDQRIRAIVSNFLRGRQKPYWWPYAICPVCGYSDKTELVEQLARKKQGILTTAPETLPPSALRRLLRRILPKKSEYRWIATIYRRA